MHVTQAIPNAVLLSKQRDLSEHTYLPLANVAAVTAHVMSLGLPITCRTLSVNNLPSLAPASCFKAVLAENGRTLGTSDSPVTSADIT